MRMVVLADPSHPDTADVDGIGPCVLVKLLFVKLIKKKSKEGVFGIL